MTFVLPLPGRDGSIAPEHPTYSLENLDNLIDHINTNYHVQQSLEIDEELGYGVYQTVDMNYVVVAILNTSWGDLLNLPHLDQHLQWSTCTWKPTEAQWVLMRKHIARQLASIIQGATGARLDASRVRYTIRRKQSQSKVYRVFSV